MNDASALERMQRMQKRYLKPAKLHLVSLMDIFTILVFFLLINSGDNQIVQISSQISLPDSVAETPPEYSVTVMVTHTDIIVDGRPVATMDEVVDSDDGIIPGLAKELGYLTKKRQQLSAEEKINGRAATILGDQTIPYEILKRVMTTCAKSNYRNLSMAVTRIANAGA
ncbi:MAG: biopolymer transporter ExbD [Candidatus Thiodiazotropha sp.]|jgi:biopolymer transport protein ExbD